MSASTEISWTDATWNVVRGCSRVSPGCDRCYAMGQAHRFSGPGGAYEGLTVLRPKSATRPGVDWKGTARLVPDQLELPLRWRKPKRIFVNSMSDLFHDGLTNEEIAAVFAVMAACPQHTFQVLTKRPKRAAEWFAWVGSQHGDEATLHPRVTCYLSAVRGERAAALVDVQSRLRPPWPDGGPWPLPNVWLGVSAENQATADERIPLLLNLPAAVRFVSAEPLLGPLDLEDWLTPQSAETCHYGQDHAQGRCDCRQAIVDWVIVGGESGNGARPFDVAWAESIVRQCADAGVACFVKQLGKVPFDSRESDRSTDEPHPDGPGADLSCRLNVDDSKGGDMSEWPESLRIRQFPEARA